jgi:hypothetical protein
LLPEQRESARRHTYSCPKRKDRLFDYDGAFVFNDLSLHLLLLISLNGFHYVILLRQERFPEIGGPLNVICKSLIERFGIEI